MKQKKTKPKDSIATCDPLLIGTFPISSYPKIRC